MRFENRSIVVTGAASGFGEAIARGFAAEGARVLVADRDEARGKQVASEIQAGGDRALFQPVDVARAEDVQAMVDCAVREHGGLHVLVNNAGFSRGLDPVGSSSAEEWLGMYQTNVLGVLRVTRALLPKLVASGDGRLINVGSTSGFEVYPGGGGYTASKHALRALTRTLRLELLGQPVQVTEVAPGLAETEFSLVRFRGDRDRAAAVYRGMRPLRAEDVAECIVWAAERPSHVNVDEIVVRPRDQATSTAIHRE